MTADRALTIAVACNDNQVLRQNLLRSPDLAAGRHQLLIRTGFQSASLAYNSALDEATHDVVVFVHQDVFLPAGWVEHLEQSIAQVEAACASWGVLGSFGSRRGAAGGLGQVYTVGLGRHGRRLSRPEPVESLDEIVLVVRRSSGLRFDDALPHYHLYGTDICLSARARGLGAFAVQTYCVHNTNQLHTLPREFYACYRYVRRKWKAALPIHTACITISRFNADVIRKRSEELAHRVLGSQAPPLMRVDDPRDLDRAASDRP